MLLQAHQELDTGCAGLVAHGGEQGNGGQDLVLPRVMLLACRGDPDAKFGAPRGLWADADGVLVADTLHGVIQRFRGDGAFLGEVAGAGAGELARPIAVARLPGNTLLLADRGDAAGVRWLGLDGRARPGGAALAEHCRDPIGFALDRRGNVYVLDRQGERVLQFTAELAFVRIVIDLAELLDDAPGSAPGSAPGNS
jgi:sugar lactone lactonase YvrE